MVLVLGVILIVHQADVAARRSSGEMSDCGHDPTAWPLRVGSALDISLVLAISVLWLKVYTFFDAYPYALAPAFDSSRPREDRDETLRRFFNAKLCCLDMGLGRQLRKAFPAHIDVYWGTPLAAFLTSIFQRWLELQFSGFQSSHQHTQ